MLFVFPFVVLLIIRDTAGYNDFPSLVTANASMAVVIEKDFFEHVEYYHKMLSEISDIIAHVVGKTMKTGGIDFAVYGDSNVNLRRVDYTVLFTVATCESTWHLHKQAEKEKLVHLAITDPDCPRIPENFGVGLPLIVPGEELPQIFFDLRVSSTLSWPKINFIHDDTLARDTISRVVKALSVELPDERLTLSARALFSTKFERNEVAMRQRLHKILADFRVEQLGTCFMAIVTFDMVFSILEVARSLKMLHPESQWLFVISESSDQETNFTSLVHFLREGENVAFVRNATDVQPNCNMGLACHVKEMIRALAKSLENSLMSEQELYDRVTEEEFEVVRLTKAERKVEIIRNMNRELSSARSLPGSGCGGCLTWKLVSAIVWGMSFDAPESAARGGPWLQETGDWSPGPGIRMTEPLFPHISHGFRGISLPVVSFHNPPWQIIKHSNNSGPVYGGLVFDILRQLSAKLNFTYTVRLPSTLTPTASTALRSDDDHSSKDTAIAAISVGHKVPHQVAELVRSRKVFLAAVALTVGEKVHEVNFTASVADQTYALLSAKPKLLSRALLFAAPFTGATWICLSSMILVIGPILHLTVRYSPRPLDPRDKTALSSLWQCSWYVYGALLQQGGMSLPRADSARLIVGTWWIVVMVVVATYSGSLIAFLTFPRMDATIDTIDDLLARGSDYRWSFPNGSALEAYLGYAAAANERYKELLAAAERQDPTKPLEILERVKSESHVFIDWRVSLTFLMGIDLNDTGTCNLHLSADDLMSENLAMLVAADSPYLRLVDAAIKRMHESGLIKKWTEDKVVAKNKCSEGMSAIQEATNHKVNMSDMQGIFFVLAIGFTCAFATIATEYFWHRRKEAAAQKLVRPFVS
ncbi:ionotropic receptor 93a [Copidosoma floridanum]|uniref:ionotropic receptor 93a n=1 Tax=Copidosoma floridanum TaxID=29053 RepID=UPI000C6F8E62|nr:ionotropic receptor 93a [Copidosoma floridanum]